MAKSRPRRRASTFDILHPDLDECVNPNAAGKVLVRVREDRIGPIAALYAPLEKAMQALLAGYSKEELKVLIDFAERSGGLLLARVSELNDSK